MGEAFAARLRRGRIRTITYVLAASVYCTACAFFGILFGARNLDFTKQQTGLMTAVAAESVVKLVAFLAVGIWVTWGVFGGLGEIFGSIARDPVWSTLLTLDQPQTASYSRWAAMLLISMMAVMFLPRQFHVLVVQNPRERDVNALAWSFPLYLLLINLFVLPIAFAGLLVFPESGGQADSFILRLPLHFESRIISVVVFLGGFSAATAMIVVDSLALSKMITNDVILPMLLRRRRLEDIYLVTLYYTRAAMLAVVGLGFAWARMERGQLLLVEMGLLSFIAVSQCAPAILSATEIEGLVHHYVGAEEAEPLVRELFRGKAPSELTVPELLELRIRFERLLAASLGAAAARMIVEDHFTISKDEAQELVTSFQQMQQSLRLTEEEVRRGERLLASVVQSVDDCIVTAGVDGRLVTMNPAGYRLLGHAQRRVGRLGLQDLLSAEDRGRAAKAIARAVEVGQGWSGQVTGRTAKGQTFPAYLSVRCIVDAGGQTIGTVGVLRDLTEQVETQRRLIQREKLASLGEMAAGVAHEIRNPLGGIKMATNLLSSSEWGGGSLSQEMARSILSGIGEIERIINSLLDFTRDTQLERGEYELVRILDPVVDAMAAEGRVRGIEVAYGRVERETVAAADGQKLRQVFTNVMKNALEAIDPRRPGGRVTVNLFVEGDRATVEVADNGVGIAPEDREKIFLPFFTTKPSGTGLGMSIVKKIVDLHGGDIVIDSASGRGTRVRISLPAVGLAHPLAGGTP